MPPPAKLSAPAAAAAQPRPRLRLLPRWLRRLPLPLLLLHSRLLDGLDVGPPAPPARSTCSSRTIHHCTVVKPLRSTCSSRLRRGPGSNSAVSSLSIRATRMAEAWAGDALPGSCAMSMGCSRSEHASLQQAHPSAAAHAGEGRAADAIRHRAVARTCLRVAPAATPVKRTRCSSPLTLKQCRAASRDGIPAEICYEKFGAFGITRTCSTWAWDVCMAATHI